MKDETIQLLKQILAEEKKQTLIFGKIAIAIKDWQGQDKHYHTKTLSKLDK